MRNRIARGLRDSARLPQQSSVRLVPRHDRIGGSLRIILQVGIMEWPHSIDFRELGPGGDGRRNYKVGIIQFRPIPRGRDNS